MNKNKRTPVLLIIILLISVVAVIILFATLIFCSTCFPSGILAEEHAPASGGADLSPMNLSDESPVYSSFEKAFSGLEEIPGLARDHESRRPQIYYIKGQNVDENGWAAQWLFEVKSTSGTELRIFNRHGWTVVPWNIIHANELINTDAILSPSGLFNESRQVIAGNLASSSASGREIELQGNVYTLTISSVNASKVMRFDATTGALIE